MVSLFARVAISAVVLFVANSYHRVHFRESPRGKATHASQRLPSGLTHFHDTSQQPAHVCLDVSSNGKAVLLEDAETPEGDTIPKGTRVCGGTDHDHPFRHPKKIAPALVSTEDLDAKETVVLVHGFTDSLDTFNDMFEELDMAGYRVLRFDLLGHGASGEAADSEYAIPVFVSQLRDLIRARAVRKTHLIGMSMGAIIATEFAVAYPDLVSSLVLLVPAGVEVNVPASGLLVRLPVLGETILRVLASYFAEPTEGDLVRGGFWRALDDGTVEKRVTRSVEWIRHSSSQRMILGVLRNIDLGDFDDRYEQLGSLGKRVLLLFAEGDRFIPMQAADKMKALVGDTAQLHLIPEARHLVHIERGDLVNGRILDFLKS